MDNRDSRKGEVEFQAMVTSKPSNYNSKTPGRTQAHVVVATHKEPNNKLTERVETLPDLDVGEILGNKKGGRISPLGPKIKPKIARLASPNKVVTVKAAKPNKNDPSFDIVGTPKALCSPPTTSPPSPDKHLISVVSPPSPLQK